MNTLATLADVGDIASFSASGTPQGEEAGNGQSCRGDDCAYQYRCEYKEHFSSPPFPPALRD